MSIIIFSARVPQRPRFESRPADVGGIAKCLQKAFFSIINFCLFDRSDLTNH